MTVKYQQAEKEPAYKNNPFPARVNSNLTGNKNYEKGRLPMRKTDRKKQRNEKDLSQKLLMSYPDVFADIVNVLLFDGEQIVKEEDLEEADTASMYKAGGRIHPLVRDVAKKWKNHQITICEIGIENQMEIDETMVFRSLAYDGFSYRAQAGNGTERYPVITIVLYFGKKPWNKPKSVYEALNIPEELKPFVNDYHLNLFELMHLDEAEVKKFRSDFALVADYLRRKDTEKYEADDKKELKHPEEAAEIMTVFGNADIRSAVQSNRKDGRITMKSLLSEAEKKQILEEATANVTREVTSKVSAENAAVIMKKMNMTLKEAMDFLEVPEEARPAVRKRIKGLA